MNFFDADGLAGKDGAEINLFAAQTEATAIGDDNGLVVKGIIKIGQSLIGAGGGLIDLGRALHVESFVRPFLIEDVDEVIKPGLLLQEVATGRFGGFFLQGEMHALMTAILLGMTRLDAFNANAQPEPPDGEFAQVEQSVCGSEGDAVIATDVGGQATLFK